MDKDKLLLEKIELENLIESFSFEDEHSFNSEKHFAEIRLEEIKRLLDNENI